MSGNSQAYRNPYCPNAGLNRYGASYRKRTSRQYFKVASNHLHAAHC